MKNAPLAAVLAASLALTSGCTTYAGSKKVAKIGGYSMLAGAPIAAFGFALWADSWQTNSENEARAGVVMTGLGSQGFLYGGVVGLLGLLGMGINDKPLRAEASTRVNAQAVRDAQARDAQARGAAVDATRRDEALAMTKTAAAAARAGDCDTAMKLDPQVLAVGSEFHATFLTDIDIKRCYPEVRALTDTAIGAARDGDCDTVMKIGRQLRDLDPVFRTNVFLTDVDIKRCYQPAVTPPIDPPPAPQATPLVAPVQP